MRLIDADALGNRMYHESFEKDSDLQRWDNGCWIRYKLFEQVLREMPTIDQHPTHPTPSNTLDALDCVDRQKAIEVLDSLHYNDREDWCFVLDAIEYLPSVKPQQKWETCFDCPLSHNCPKINGCTNGQTMEYASEVPDDCPISAQPRKGKWIYSEGLGYGNPYGHYECDLCGDGYGYKTNFCPTCGADMRPQFEEPEINPCRGCEDYDGKGGCKSKGGCADRRGEQDG